MIRRTVLLAIAVLAASGTPLLGEGGAPHFIVSGTSTVRSWSCPADGSVKIVPAASGQAVPGFAHGLQSVEVTVAVKAIACEEPLMLEHLRETMNEKAFPQIVYRLEHYELTSADAAKATGTLTIAGVTKPVALDLQLAPASAGMRARGETIIDLTQFGLKPPVIFDGLLKVGKDVRVRFDAVLAP